MTNDNAAALSPEQWFDLWFAQNLDAPPHHVRAMLAATLTKMITDAEERHDHQRADDLRGVFAETMARGKETQWH